MGEKPTVSGISDELVMSVSTIISRELDFERATLSSCKEAAVLVVLGLVSEGWMVFRPIAAPHNSAMSANYQYIQNTFPGD